METWWLQGIKVSFPRLLVTSEKISPDLNPEKRIDTI